MSLRELALKEYKSKIEQAKIKYSQELQKISDKAELEYTKKIREIDRIEINEQLRVKK